MRNKLESELALRESSEFLKKLDSLAEKMGISRSALVRQFLRESMSDKETSMP